MTFHRAFLLEFERALLSVVPDLQALPYWDMTRDTRGEPTPSLRAPVPRSPKRTPLPPPPAPLTVDAARKCFLCVGAQAVTWWARPTTCSATTGPGRCRAMRHAAMSWRTASSPSRPSAALTPASELARHAGCTSTQHPAAACRSFLLAKWAARPRPPPPRNDGLHRWPIPRRRGGAAGGAATPASSRARG